MNKLIVIGNLTRDPETRTVSSGSTVCSFTVAVNRKGNNSEADCFRISAWNKLGDVCQRYLAKGRKVCVTGSVSVSSYDGRNGEKRFSLDVFAENVEFLSPRERSDADESKPPANQYAEYVEDDDLPF